MSKRTTKTAPPFKVFDKVSWHYPDGKDCPSLKAGKRHIEYIYRLLDRNALLSEEGKKSLEHPFSEESSLTTDDVTPEGNALLAKHYAHWLKLISYRGRLHTEFWKNKLTRGVSSAIPEGDSRYDSSRGARSKTAPRANASQAESRLHDRIDFHWPANKRDGCKTLEHAKFHFVTIMEWLKQNRLLSRKGLSAFRSGTVPDDFELRESLVTKTGAQVLRAQYDEWFGEVAYRPGPHDTRRLDKALKKLM